MIAAFDYARVCREAGHEAVALFIAHREESCGNRSVRPGVSCRPELRRPARRRRDPSRSGTSSARSRRHIPRDLMQRSRMRLTTLSLTNSPTRLLRVTVDCLTMLNLAFCSD